MTQRLPAIVLAVSLSVFARRGSAQDAEPTRSHAFVVNGGPMIGILGGGIYGRLNPEFQMHRENRYGGHMLGLGFAFVPWPNEGGPSFSFAPRYQYDHQLVPGTLFFVSPYVGLDVGLGVFNIFNGGDPRFRFVASPMAGIDVKMIFGRRIILGFRPIGVTVPLFFGGSPPVTADVIYDIALSFGFLYGQ